MEPMVTMTGRVGHMPELRVSRNGAPYTRFRIAHTPRLLRDGQWVDGDTSWVTVLCHRDLAVNAATCLRKGDPVVVSGRGRVESWIDDETKALRESLMIEARTLGHDMALGESRFTRVRHERRGEEDDDRADETSAPEVAAADTDGGGVPDTAEELLAQAPF